MSKYEEKKKELAEKAPKYKYSSKLSREYHKANRRYKKTGTGLGRVLSMQPKLEREEFASRNKK